MPLVASPPRQIEVGATYANQLFMARDWLGQANIRKSDPAFNEGFLYHEEIHTVPGVIDVQTLKEAACTLHLSWEGMYVNNKLAYLIQLLIRQREGEPGDLDVDGKENVIFVLGEKGFKAVCAIWHSYFHWQLFARDCHDDKYIHQPGTRLFGFPYIEGVQYPRCGIGEYP